MKPRTPIITAILITVLSFAAGIYFYPMLPERVASHWGADGQVNGYMSRFWGVFLLPIITLAILALLIFLPKLDPKKENIEKFRKYFDGFIVCIILFLTYLHGLALAWNLGIKFELLTFLIPAFAGLFYCAGVLVQHAEPNWMIGIRTPWTLSSEHVWKATHELGARLFKASAAIALLGLAFPKVAIWLVIAPSIVSALWMFVYSYLEFRRTNIR